MPAFVVLDFDFVVLYLVFVAFDFAFVVLALDFELVFDLEPFFFFFVVLSFFAFAFIRCFNYRARARFVIISITSPYAHVNTQIIF